MLLLLLPVLLGFAKHCNSEEVRTQKTHQRSKYLQVVAGGCEEVSLACAGSGMIVVHSATFLPLEGDCEQVTKVFFFFLSFYQS